MEKQHPINEMMSTTMEKIRSMMDANTIIGDPIQTGEVTLIPVSRLSFGFASGGSDFVTKNQKPGAENTFGGGSGASAKMEPVAFLIIKGDSVKLLPVDVTVLDQVLIPDVVKDDLPVNFSGSHPVRSYPFLRRRRARKGLGI